MPVIGLSVKRLNRLLGRDLAVETLSEHLGDIGCDVEESCDVDLYTCPACGNGMERLEEEAPPRECDFCGFAAEQALERSGKDRVIKISLLAARPDLMDMGGLVRALKGILGIETGLPAFPVSRGGIRVDVDPELKKKESFRPWIVCAAVALPPIDADGLKDIMKLQENLHWAIARDRKLSSIGVYDLDTVAPPIAYRAVGREALRFTALGRPGAPMTPNEILESHPKGIAYAHLLRDHAKVPILIDSGGQVLSMPPIINSEETKVRVGSSRLFIDVTGLTEASVTDALHTLVCSLAALGGRVESTEIYDAGAVRVTPDLEPRAIPFESARARAWLGLDLSDEQFVSHLERMRCAAKVVGEGKLDVLYPAYRVDIRHPVDLFEDVAISFDYRNIKPVLDSNYTIARQRPEEKRAALVRSVLTGLGLTEIMSLTQTTEAGHFLKFRLAPGEAHVKIANPKSSEYNVLRTHLMTGLMECLEKNRRKSPPIRIFELGNVFRPGPSGGPETVVERRAAFACMGPRAGYAEGRSIADSVLRELGVSGAGYAALGHPAFTEGRAASIEAAGETIGILGEIHPEVLEAFSVSYPVVLGELRVCKVEIPPVYPGAD
jgi:phenylalanyl-tRNA synthetase beta chain